MVENLDLIEYRQGMFKKGLEPDDFPVEIWSGDEVPATVRTAIKTENLMNLGGVYGNKKGGDSIEYDYLKMVLTPELLRSQCSIVGLRCSC